MTATIETLADAVWTAYRAGAPTSDTASREEIRTYWYGVLKYLNQEIERLKEQVADLYERDDCEPWTEIFGQWGTAAVHLDTYTTVRSKITSGPLAGPDDTVECVEIED